MATIPQDSGSAVLPGPGEPVRRAAAKPAPANSPPLPARTTSIAAALKEPSRGWTRAELKRMLTGAGVATLIHAVVLIVLATIFLPADIKERIFSIVATAPEDEPEMLMESVDMPETLDDLQENVDPVETASEAVADDPNPVEIDVNDLDPSIAMEDSALAAPSLKLSSETGGRSSAAKAVLVKQYGGTAASEEAVARGLKWLAKIQQADGSWSYSEIGGASGAGQNIENDRMVATGTALLAFLGGGHTHEKDGPYKENVRKGIDYLVNHVKITPTGGDFSGGVKVSGSDRTMYAQGLVGIAIAEAHGMTKDRRLRRAAESAATFIINAQDPKGGGWRYIPHQAGDTSAVGWQVMALKGAQAAKLRIPPTTFQGVNVFLDSVTDDGGATYGYVAPKDRPAADACTAIGLLCRMYLGWEHKNPHLKQGVEILAKAGPNGDMYRNYYATQVLHHWGGDEWTAWNNKMREQLVTRQEKDGEHAGSFKPGGGHSGAAGGRLFETCLSVMTLEVYYRHLPLYDRTKVQVEF